ncbi:MAG TPA: phosphate ABC transporter substrate-binding protein PstS [Burkholderiaceae bacterium]|jgi:phosphate transport system substrate-binding protein
MSRFLLALVALLAASASFAQSAPIRGAGATFPAPVYARWAAQYRPSSGIEIRYEAIGSGAGIERIEHRQVDFGASDIPLTSAERERMGLLQFPVVIGGVVPVVNISGVKSGELRLTGRVLADIYLGKVRKWNDRAIAELNPKLDLPSSNITVVHRADSSGTTQLWSEFLSRANPEWKARVGAAKLLNWPTGVADVGNEGVASSVQRTRMSIGYVEYAYARQHQLSVASLRNRDGRFVMPRRSAFEAAAAAASWNSPADLDQALVDPAGADSWPLVGASFILLPTEPQASGRTLEAMRFFEWALKNGQQSAEDLDYVPLPHAAVRQIEKAFEQLQTSKREKLAAAATPAETAPSAKAKAAPFVPPR